MTLKLIDMVWRNEKTLNLSTQAFKVLLRLSALSQQTRGSVCDRICDMSSKTGLVPQTVKAAIQELVDRKLIFLVGETLSGDDLPNVYQINAAALKAICVPQKKAEDPKTQRRRKEPEIGWEDQLKDLCLKFDLSPTYSQILVAFVAGAYEEEGSFLLPSSSRVEEMSKFSKDTISKAKNAFIEKNLIELVASRDYKTQTPNIYRINPAFLKGIYSFQEKRVA